MERALRMSEQIGRMTEEEIIKFNDFMDRYTRKDSLILCEALQSKKMTPFNCWSAVSNEVMRYQTGYYWNFNTSELVLMCNVLFVSHMARPSYIFPPNFDIVQYDAVAEIVERVRNRLPGNMKCTETHIAMYDDDDKKYKEARVYVFELEDGMQSKLLEKASRDALAAPVTDDQFNNYEKVMGAALGFPEDASAEGENEYHVMLANPFGTPTDNGQDIGGDFLTVMGFRYDTWNYDAMNKTYYDVFEHHARSMLGPPARKSWDIAALRQEEEKVLEYDEDAGEWLSSYSPSS